VAAGLASIAYLEVNLRRSLERGAREELERHALSFRAALELMSNERVDELAKAAGARHGIRFTVVAPDGDVLADSSVARERLDTLEAHHKRPEVVAALAGEVGASQRYSTTVKNDLLYVAIPSTRGVVVRAARPLADVDQLIGDLRLALGVAGLLGLGVAVFMSGLASQLITRRLRTVVTSARMLADGVEGTRREEMEEDEIDRLAGSVNRIADFLDDAVGKVGEARARLHAVLEAMGEGLLVVDEDRLVTLANPAAHKLLAISSDPVGRPVVEVARAPALLDLLDAGDEGEAEVTLPVQPPRRLRVRLSPLSRSSGHVIVLHDVTAMRRLETLRSDFVANVSHELRTPVAVIQANAEALQDGAFHDEERGPGFVQALHRNAERLSALIADLLDLARIESGRFQPRAEDVNLRALVDNALLSLERRAAEREHTLENVVPEDTQVWADAGALEQIIVNFVDNAVKYTPEKCRVEVGAQRRGERVRMEVRDDGPGVPPEHRERIFERFYRVDTGRSREMGGTGLGLSIVKHLAHAMGGAIGVEANQPRGAIFWAELPATRYDVPKVPVDADEFLA
jgi:two-component system phosphate regulon sensor histidine kinase PhoR